MASPILHICTKPWLTYATLYTVDQTSAATVCQIATHIPLDQIKAQF